MAKYNNEEINYLTYLVNETSTTWPQRAQLMSDKFNKEYNVNSIKSYVNHRKRSDAWDYQKGKSAIKTEVKGNGEQTSEIKLRMTAEQAKDPDYVLQAHGYDSQNWEIVKLTSNVWEQNSSSDGLVQLYQSKIIVKPKVVYNTADIIEALKKDVHPKELKRKIHGSRNLIIPLADWHFGITKFEDIELKLSDLINILHKGYKTIVIEQLGDLFHSSQIKKSQTMRGTELDSVNMEKAIDDAKVFFDILIVSCIEHANEIIVQHAEGNHSGNLEYMFLIYLEAKYPQIKVNYHNQYRYAYLLDNVGIFLTHGQYAKKKELPLLFATEFPDIWSKATTRELQTGHFHTQQTLDYDGVIHRQLGTVKPNDNYEIENGYTMGKKVWQIFEYDTDRLRVTYDL